MASRSSPLLVNFGPGVSPPKVKSGKKFGNAYLVDRLCNRAEILSDGISRWVLWYLAFLLTWCSVNWIQHTFNIISICAHYESANCLSVARPILLLCLSLAEVVITSSPPVILWQVSSQSFSFFKSNSSRQSLSVIFFTSQSHFLNFLHFTETV